ncbi:MAG: anti-sigma factor [Actinomycetota bacterium]|nr:anti-sigma factor [Actinomycetota bacterium]
MSGLDFEARHRDCAEALGAYALHALPDEDMHDLELHLRSCERCREDLAGLRLAVDALPAAASPLMAPPQLKQRILSSVSSEAQLLRAAGAEADRVPVRRPPRRSGLRMARPALAGLVAAAVAGVGVVGFFLGGGVSGGASTRTVQARVLPGSAEAASTRVALRVHGNRGTLVVRDLPAPPSQRVYQVWVQRSSSSPVPAGARFALRSGAIEIPHSLAGIDAVMVTDEPVDGSATPTRSPIVVARPA